MIVSNPRINPTNQPDDRVNLTNQSDDRVKPTNQPYAPQTNGGRGGLPPSLPLLRPALAGASPGGRPPVRWIVPRIDPARSCPRPGDAAQASPAFGAVRV